MQVRRRLRACSEAGAVAVEFALIMPLLLLLVFGIIDFGWMINRDMLVDNASRDGARVASLGGTFNQVCTAVKSELSASGVTVPTTCNLTSTPTTVTTIKVDCVKTTGAACNATSSNYDAQAVSGTTAIVTITYNHRWITPLTTGVFGRTRPIVETSQMVVE